MIEEMMFLVNEEVVKIFLEKNFDLVFLRI